MASRNKRSGAQLRGLVLGLGLLGVFATLGLASRWISSVETLRNGAGRAVDVACQEGRNCEERAVLLQAREVVTTEALFDLAFYQALINVAGLIGLGLTVNYAHRAWAETKRSADIADRALGGLERPFLVLKIEKSGIEVRKDSTRYGTTTYKLVNFGRTPAIVTRRHFAMAWSEPEPIDPCSGIGRKVAFGVIIGAGEESPIYGVGDAIPIISSFEQHKAGRPVNRRDPYLIGFVQYRDLMGSEYVTGFCLEHREGSFDLASWITADDEDKFNYDRKIS